MGIFDFFKKTGKQSHIAEPQTDYDHLTEEGELPWGWLYHNKEFVDRTQTEYTHFLNNWIDATKKSPKELYPALKSFALYLEDLEKEYSYTKDNSRPTILLVINPHCPFCHRVHKKLWGLSDYNIELIFLTKENDRKAELVAAYILEQFHNWNLSWETANELIEDYYKKSIIPNSWRIEDKFYDILMQHRAFCIENNISGTPTVLINGRRIPEQYVLTDLEYIL